MAVSHRKQHGVHYTPPELASFLARAILRRHRPITRPLRVLDPGCGDGGLLAAFCDAVPKSRHRHLRLIGYERDERAIVEARERLGRFEVADVTVEAEDFLEVDGIEASGVGVLPFAGAAPLSVDVVISNPPYVRTQVLGANAAQRLARRFGLTGRVDLYHAFTMAMANVLNPGGMLGLLTSNRFLTIRSGERLRSILQSRFDLNAVYDLGDTKLFAAAVLPAIVIGTKRNGESPAAVCTFDRVYEHRNGTDDRDERFVPFVLDAIEDRAIDGLVGTDRGRYRIERGELAPSSSSRVWTLSTPESRQWLQVVSRHQAATFEDLGCVRVGVKTTADEVFIRDWNQVDPAERPERRLLHPLITHHVAGRWNAEKEPAVQRTILYPHVSKRGKKSPIDLARYPKAAAYLRSHKRRLSRRKYVLEAGREWFEIWVPQNPDAWSKPKIVYPDISEFPRFWIDRSGAIVNGDCYWIVLRPDVDEQWLLLMLAVANSTFATKYYDTLFHNKLYAGRRRFMTQYVKSFPLPDLAGRISKKIVDRVGKIVERGATPRLEREIDKLVWESFGVADWAER